MSGRVSHTQAEQQVPDRRDCIQAVSRYGMGNAALSIPRYLAHSDSAASYQEANRGTEVSVQVLHRLSQSP